MRQLFELWPTYLKLDTPYTTARIIDVAHEQIIVNSTDRMWLKEFLLTVAPRKGKEHEISPERLGLWLRRISGRPASGHKLIRGRSLNVASFRLVEMS